MTVNTHKIRKDARANSEDLPDISGTNITYAGSTVATVEIMQRRNDEPTVEAGSSITVAGYTGVCTEMSAEIKPEYKLDGTVVWEVNYTLKAPGESV